MYQRYTAFFFGCTALQLLHSFSKSIYMRTTEFAQLWKKTVHFSTNTIVNEIKKKGQCTKDVQLLSLVAHLFNGCTSFWKYIYIRTTEFVQLWKKLYILEKTPLWMKLKAKDSVPKMYSFFLWMYSFLIVLLVFKNIHMRTKEFVQLWKKLSILLQTPLWMKLRAQYSVPKMYSFFFGCTAF